MLFITERTRTERNRNYLVIDIYNTIIIEKQALSCYSSLKGLGLRETAIILLVIYNIIIIDYLWHPIS